MSLKRILTLISLTMGTFLVGILVVVILLYQTMYEIVESEENRYESYVRADELRQSSDDLTRLARTYVVTRDDRYETMYWDILAIRNGEKPRPEKYERIYWDFIAAGQSKPRPDGETIPLRKIMENLGFTQEEFGKLQEAQKNSDGLVTTETIAMNAVKGLYDNGQGEYTKQGEPDFEMSRQIMHDTQYHIDKAKIMDPIDQFFELLDTRTRNIVEHFVFRGDLFLWLLILLVVGLGATAVIGFISINKWLENMAKQLSVAAEDLTITSQGVAKSSQQLSQGTTQQAASLEETSSSMEEVSSQTKETADNAVSVDEAMVAVADMLHHAVENTQTTTHLSEEARNSAESGVDAMGEIAAAMKEIREGSEKVTEIIEVIDEITHQTKMLATNAAIEAARAGDQGKGFAVVADEVSKLAEHSKTAAKEIAGLIKESTRKAKIGSDLSEKGQKVLQEILGKSSEVANLLNEISRSSVEQTQKVEQVGHLVDNIKKATIEQAGGTSEVSRAILEMDQITQTNAANAEETASLAGNLSMQAQTLRNLVNGLTQKVNYETKQTDVLDGSFDSKSDDIQASDFQESKKSVALIGNPPKQIKPSKAIPMRDDFKEF